MSLESALNSGSRNKAAAILAEVHAENASRKHDRLMTRLGAMTGTDFRKHQHKQEVKTQQDSFGVEVVNERDTKIKKITSRLDHLQHGEIDQVLAMIEKFEAESK